MVFVFGAIVASFDWGAVSEAKPWPIVEFFGYFSQLLIGELGQVSSFREVLPVNVRCQGFETVF